MTHDFSAKIWTISYGYIHRGIIGLNSSQEEIKGGIDFKKRVGNWAKEGEIDKNSIFFLQNFALFSLTLWKKNHKIRIDRGLDTFAQQIRVRTLILL